MSRTFLNKAGSVTVSLLLAMSMLLGGCGGAKGNAVAPETKKPAAQATEPATPQQQQEKKAEEIDKKMSGARNTPIVQAARKVGPTVVGITNKAYVRDFFNRVQLAERGYGSGVIYDKSGLIVTNNHVVDGASEIIVSLADGRSAQGKVLGTDAATDLAVVKIELDNLPVAEFGDSSTVQVGEPAIAIGNPLGMEFRGSVTVGIISALNRSVEIGEKKFTLFQTDAAIDLILGEEVTTADGEIIGINSAKIAVSNVEGIGFAIPINNVKPIIKELASKGRVAHPYVGASLIDKTIAKQYGFDMDLHDGLFIMKLSKGGPLARAGARTGDIITEFNGVKVQSVAALRDEIAKHKVGDQVNITVLRNENQMTLAVVLQEYPRN